MALQPKSTLSDRQCEYMMELMKIVNEVFNLNILTKTNRNKYVEARMAFSKILREKGMTYCSIGSFLEKDHSTVVNYIAKFDIYFKASYLNSRYELCCELFYKEKSAKNFSEYNDESIKESRKYRRFKNILDLMNEKLPEGKEDFMENKIRLFLNSI